MGTGGALNGYKNRKAGKITCWLSVSGYQDSNLGPPAPKAGALTGLRYTPIVLSFSLFAVQRYYIFLIPQQFAAAFCYLVHFSPPAGAVSPFFQELFDKVRQWKNTQMQKHTREVAKCLLTNAE